MKSPVSRGRLPQRLRLHLGVVGEHRRGRDAEEGAEAEEQADRELLRAAHGDVEADDAGDRADEGDDAPAAGDVAAEVGADGCYRAGQGDEAHRLAEDGAGAVAADGDRLLGDLLEAAHAEIVLARRGASGAAVSRAGRTRRRTRARAGAGDRSADPARSPRAPRPRSPPSRPGRRRSAPRAPGRPRELDHDAPAVVGSGSRRISSASSILSSRAVIAPLVSPSCFAEPPRRAAVRRAAVAQRAEHAHVPPGEAELLERLVVGAAEVLLDHPDPVDDPLGAGVEVGDLPQPDLELLVDRIPASCGSLRRILQSESLDVKQCGLLASTKCL